MEIQNGDIIRLKSDNCRDWVAIHYSNCNMRNRIKHNKYNKNHTGFYLFSGLWYEGDVLTSEPYGKCIERLGRGMFPNIEVIGNIGDSLKFNLY